MNSGGCVRLEQERGEVGYLRWGGYVSRYTGCHPLLFHKEGRQIWVVAGSHGIQDL